MHHDTHTAITDWAVSPSSTAVPYDFAVREMEQRAVMISEGRAAELIWLLEHPPIYTAGTSANPGDLLDTDRFPIFKTGRGGQYTYHGPGQQVIYVMLDVKRRFGDVRCFVSAMEAWMLDTLRSFEIEAITHRDRVGVWVPVDAAGNHHFQDDDQKTVTGIHTTEEKIAAIGIRLKRWVSFHGMSLNVDPDLSHFDGIVPCGITQYGTTSLNRLGRPNDRKAVQDALRRNFEIAFGPTRTCQAPPPADAIASHLQ
ncbi:MAG: lipoyl(octanoyl) transferase LipB [Pseudomonadota bacterium]